MKTVSGNRVRQMREERGLTGKQLAELCHVTTPTIYNVEDNLHCPSLAIAVTIAEALGTNVYDLFTFEEK